jgi:hypothetical protein
MMALHADANGNGGGGSNGRGTAGSRLLTSLAISRAPRIYTGEIRLSDNPTEEELAALHFIVSEQKAQLESERRVLESRRAAADESSIRRAQLTSLHSSSVSRTPRARLSEQSFARNLEAEFDAAVIVPKTRDVALIDTAAYIAANKPRNDENATLYTLAIKGMKLLRNIAEEHMPQRNNNVAAQPQPQSAPRAGAPRSQGVNPINGELHHSLTQQRVDAAHRQRAS